MSHDWQDDVLHDPPKRSRYKRPGRPVRDSGISLGQSHSNLMDLCKGRIFHALAHNVPRCPMRYNSSLKIPLPDQLFVIEIGRGGCG